MKTAIAINLRRLRKMKKLTQQELAEMAGISRTAYRNIETGTSMPRGANLSALARALEVSVFMLTEEIPRLRSLRFRSLKKLSSQQKAEREQIAADVAIWLENFNELERMLDLHKHNSFKENDFTKSDPKYAAAETRRILGLHEKMYITDICELLEKAGVKLFLMNSILEAFSGLSVGMPDGGPAIAVNAEESIPVERQIFTAIHELGHLLLHPGSFVYDQLEEDMEQESEANEFASYFLMPKEQFEQAWSESRGLHWVESVLHTKRLFLVSYRTVLRRLIDIGVADDSIYKKFSQTYTNLYGRRLRFKEEPGAYYETSKNEPSNLQNEGFIEGRLSRLVRDALERDLISISRAAEILNITVSKMRARVEEWEMFDGG
jgi:Zn-dependent peptidase ImmA (M78 family)/DNA-binding XRE family transcriptional regulator